MSKSHFAGINTVLQAESAEGHPILVSFASMLDGHQKAMNETILPMLRDGRFDEAILDSGAFTVLTKGIEVSIDQYIAFCLEHGHLFDQVVTLDDIAGDLATTWNNTAKMIDAGLDPVPVFHGREPFAVLEHYVANFKRVGLGFFRGPSKPGGKVTIQADQGDGLTPDEWLSKALDICERAGVKVHGFGMTRYAMKKGHTRLTTTDSTSWSAEYLALRKRSTKGSDRLGDGDAALLLCNLADSELIRLAMASYRGSGADEEVITLTKECRGQANTVLNRFNSSELASMIELFDSEAAAFSLKMRRLRESLRAI
jgi:hypothetical protein